MIGDLDRDVDDAQASMNVAMKQMSKLLKTKGATTPPSSARRSDISRMLRLVLTLTRRVRVSASCACGQIPAPSG